MKLVYSILLSLSLAGLFVNAIFLVKYGLFVYGMSGCFSLFLVIFVYSWVKLNEKEDAENG